ncbi:hypothetical protein PSL85_20575, partial [Clostridioides difficile]|uniref:hypothetical protein n=1 Tax=Clostridioides difficile TaxID=1496 RepID=UPI0023586246
SIIKTEELPPLPPKVSSVFSLVILLNDKDMWKLLHPFSLEVLCESIDLFDYGGHFANLF